MNICIIPCFDRPEFLTLCLERIAMADHYNEIKYLFAVDFGYNKEIEKVIAAFPATHKEIYFTNRSSFGITKQSLNVLNAYRMAAEQTDGLIFMIEEDVMIANDFFVWHELVHARDIVLFCSIATANNNRKVKTTNNLEQFYVTTGDYQSLGVCFPAEAIQKLIVEHINGDYFRSPMKYCKTLFPKSSIGEAFCEQDGLIRRIEEAERIGIAFPHVPRAFHAGFYGKNRGRRISGSFQQRLDTVRSIIFNDQEMQRVNGKNIHLYQDSKPVNLDNPYLRLAYLNQDIK